MQLQALLWEAAGRIRLERRAEDGTLGVAPNEEAQRELDEIDARNARAAANVVELRMSRTARALPTPFPNTCPHLLAISAKAQGSQAQGQEAPKELYFLKAVCSVQPDKRNVHYCTIIEKNLLCVLLACMHLMRTCPHSDLDCSIVWYHAHEAFKVCAQAIVFKKLHLTQAMLPYVV